MVFSSSGRKLSLADIIVFAMVVILTGVLVLPLRSKADLQSKIAQDRENLSTLSKMSQLYAVNENGGIFPIGPARAIKTLVTYGYIMDVRVLQCPSMPAMDPDMLTDNANPNPASHLHNQYFYNWENAYKMHNDTDTTYCFGNAPIAWSSVADPFTHVAKCDGTVYQLFLRNDPSGASSIDQMVHPERINDKIFQASALPPGQVDTFLMAASDTTTWF